MTAAVKYGARTVLSGDSITVGGWATVSGGLIDTINAQIPTSSKLRRSRRVNGSRPARMAAAVGTRGARVVNSTFKPNLVVLNTAIAGQLTQNLLADVVNQITSKTPDLVILHIGINDSWAPVDPTTVTKPNYEAILQAIRAYSASVPIVCIGLMYYGEQYDVGPVWSNSPSADVNIDLNNGFIQALCVTYNCTFVDMRTTMLTYETVHNTPLPGLRIGPLSQDGLHPNDTGRLLMGTIAAPFFKVP